MKEIGEEFKDKREEIGISVEEASADLKIDSVVIKNFEEGNDKVFKDIIQLKDFIENYSKYLGIESEKIIDELNDYLFSKTSKIRVEDIKEELPKEKEEKKIFTPYTRDLEEKNKNRSFKIILLLIVVLLLVFYIILRKYYIG